MLGIEIVSSQNKLEGWKTYAKEIDSFLSKPKPTSEELKITHHLLTSNAVTDMLLCKEDLIADLYTLDREDALQKAALLSDNFRKRSHEFNRIANPNEYFAELKRTYKKLCEEDTEIKFDVVIPGELRRLGHRKIKNSEWKTIYHAHTNVYENKNPDITDLEEMMPKTYFGISTGLDKAYTNLCDKYDKLREQGKSLDERLLAEGFLQMIGTRVLHPFWDGNGRVFAGHISLMLEREGIQAKEKSLIDQTTYGLTQLTETFLEHTLESARLGFISGNQHFSIHFDPKFRNTYMTQLYSTLMNNISNGLNESSKEIDFYSNAAWLIKRVLIKNELVEPTILDSKRLRVEDYHLQPIPPEDRNKFLVVIPHSELKKL
jgi:hypothetical protein